VAAHIAARQADKISRMARIKTFSLDGIEGFHHWQHAAIGGNGMNRGLGFCFYYFQND
jgi:hypothetical protein